MIFVLRTTVPSFLSVIFDKREERLVVYSIDNFQLMTSDFKVKSFMGLLSIS